MGSAHRQVAKYVSTHRVKRGLSQQQLADLIGVTKPTISYWESAKFLPQMAVLERLARALGGSYEDLLALIGYAQPKGLPAPEPYLRARYSRVSPRKLAEAKRLFAELDREEEKKAKKRKGGKK